MDFISSRISFTVFSKMEIRIAHKSTSSSTSECFIATSWSETSGEVARSRLVSPARIRI